MLDPELVDEGDVADRLAVPLIYGITQSVFGRGPSFRVPAILGLVIAGLTQLIYPYLYWQLLSLNFTMLLALSARNVLYAVLLAWAVTSLVGLFRAHSSAPLPQVESADAVAKPWPFAEKAGGSAS
ncbi:MAG: hypothetical protein JF618_13860 [Leifsonia sp.]|nr:hypothetical protein [Leifsonia sp.]